LNLSGSTPRTESRLKSLFWPSVESGADVDYLGAQGYWLCTIIAVATFIFLTLGGQPGTGVLFFLYFYLGGVGVREHSRYAAAAVFLLYFADLILSVGVILSGFGIVKIFFAALLLSNLRATWISAAWKPGSEEAALPPRLNQTLGDRFADQLPGWLWPKIRIVYYILSVLTVVLVVIGITYMRLHPTVAR